jgi:cysteinyl-tRNA synthetase
MADRWLWEEPRIKGLLTEAGLARPHVFDIHGGGIDLVFPHHENEIAQSRSAHGTPVMANVWMHNGFLQVEGEKMSKSLGNFVTIHELLGEWTGGVVRYTMLQTHYNQPIDWTVAKLERSRSELGMWAGLYSGSEAHHDYQFRKYRKIPPKPSKELIDALSDNLNTPQAITVLREQFSRSAGELSKEFFQDCEFLGLVDPEKMGSLESEHATGSVAPRLLFDSFPALLRLRVGVANSRTDVVEHATRELRDIGVSARDMKEGFFELQPLSKDAELDTTRIEEMIAARNAARKAKNFKEADRIREELAAMGIQLKDAKDPATGEITTTWEAKR